MHALLQILNLSDNPVFHRFRRSQLRLKASLAWLLLTLIVTPIAYSLFDDLGALARRRRAPVLDSTPVAGD